MKNTILFLFSLLLVTACHTPNPKSESAAAKGTAPEANLTQVEAQARAQQVSQVNYKLRIDLDEKSETFGGEAQIQFDLGAPAHGLFLDFKNVATIESASINGKPVTVALSNHRIDLPDNELKTGTNTVEIKYRQTYSNNG